MLILNQLIRSSAITVFAFAWLFPQAVNAHAGSHFGALGDFDGDRQPDLAVASPQGAVSGGYRYRIDVRLSAHPATTFEIESRVPDGLHLSARDIDGDHDLDLVITSEFSRELVGIWINDGNGNFSQGQARIDPSSIWQEAVQHAASCHDETRHAPALTSAPTGTVSDSSRIEPISPLAFLFHKSAARATSARLNPGSPLRAPPTSWR